VIYTVFVTGNSEQDQWQAELLEYSWQKVRQAGELVRLVACGTRQALPMHALARVVRTRSWNPHPFLFDHYAAYNTPAALLEWILQERVDGSLLLLDSHNVLFKALNEEVACGQAMGNEWGDMPRGGAAPFGLTAEYQYLQAYCVNRTLALEPVQLPLLIHSRDLKKILARWLELTGIMRAQVSTHAGRPGNAHELAYVIAAAEYGIAHQPRKLALTPGDQKADSAVMNYSHPIQSARSKVVWDMQAYQPWAPCQPKDAKAGAGREFLNLLQEYQKLRESFGHFRLRRPRRRQGVREASILDNMVLELPSRAEPLSLNRSAAAIWRLCDNQRTMADIAEALEHTFQVPRQALCPDIELALYQLRVDGALDLEIPA